MKEFNPRILINCRIQIFISTPLISNPQGMEARLNRLTKVTSTQAQKFRKIKRNK
jgi:hypothetical protein